MKLVLLGVLATFSISSIASEKCVIPPEEGGKCLPEQVEMAAGILHAWPEPHHQPSSCAVGTNVIMETGTISGPIISLSEFVEGQCTLYVDPNNRTYKVWGQLDGCGSIRWTGVLQSINGPANLEVVDHRNRMCDDEVIASIVVTEEYPYEPSRTKVLYGNYPNFEPIPQPVPVPYPAPELDE